MATPQNTTTEEIKVESKFPSSKQLESATKTNVTSQFGDKGQYTYKVDTAGIPYGAPVNTSNTISAESLKGTTPLTLPEQPQTNSGGLEGEISGLVASNKNANIEALKNKSDTSLQDLMSEVVAGGQISSSVDRSAQDAAKKKSDLYTSQIEQEQLRTRRELESLERNNPQGLGVVGLQSKMRDIERDSLSKQADLAILQTAANRDYDTAASIADRKVSLLMEQSKANIDAKKLFYEANKEAFTTAEGRQYEQQIKAEERAYNKKENELKEVSDISLTIGQNGAPQGMIQKALAAKTKQELMAIPGISKYLRDPLEVAMKNAQLNKLRAELSSGGLSSKEVAEKLENDKAKIEKFTEIASLTKRLKDMKGKEAATGASSVFNFIPGTEQFTYKRTAEQLLNTLAAGNLDQLKGAMSDKDILFLKNINTSLDTGMSTEEFDKELDRIYNKVETKLKNDYGMDFSLDIKDMSNEDFLNASSQEVSNEDFFNK